MTIQQAIAQSTTQNARTAYIQSKVFKVRIAVYDGKFFRVIKGTGDRGYYFGGQYRVSPTEVMAMDYEVFTVDNIEDGKE